MQSKINPRGTLNDEEDAILIISIVAFASVADVEWIIICGRASRREEVVVVLEKCVSAHTVALEGHEVHEETASSEYDSCVV